MAKHLLDTDLSREPGRVVTPSHKQWKDAGGVLAKVLEQRPDLKNKLPALVNDWLLALSARSLGATLYSRNRDDFMVLQSIRSFALVVISWQNLNSRKVKACPRALP